MWGSLKLGTILGYSDSSSFASRHASLVGCLQQVSSPAMLLRRHSLLSRCTSNHCFSSVIPRVIGPIDRVRSYATEAGLEKPTLLFSCLNSRSLIRLTGDDADPFLQGLLTANISQIAQRSIPKHLTKPEHPLSGYAATYTAFLNAQGRILNDVCLWKKPESAEWLIEVDTAARPSLLAHLKKHKLRSKIKLENVSSDDIAICSAWSESATAPVLRSQPTETWGPLDPRHAMGFRWLGNKDELEQMAGSLDPFGGAFRDAQQATEEEYKIHRMRAGVAEGQNEIITGSSLPQESNIDLFGGIDFRKGCYLGQELTIRTHHTGVVRKRVLPVQLYNEQSPIDPNATGIAYEGDTGLILPPPGSNISKVSSRGRSTGKWLGGVGNIGLALCRLEMMTDIRLTEEPTQYDQDQEFKIAWEAEGDRAAGEVKVKAFVPRWLRAGLAERLEVREKKSTKDEETEEVD